VGDVYVLDVPQNTHGSGGNGGAGTTGTGDSKPIINMGAIMISAEIFAKRSMEQARGAALRGDKRRRWRMGCAKRDLEVWDVECGTGLMRTKKDNNTNADHDTTTTTTTDNDEDMDTDETHGSGGWVEAVLRNSLRNCTNAFAVDGRNAGGMVTESSDSDDDDTDEEDDHDDNEMMGGYYASRNDALA